ncbi:MAG TPA: dihydroneopterin aldolase [Porphyromonadaceae bacterium]|nr:dihydroneopterin aldolase [Porphyromonadaceae bacterium]
MRVTITLETMKFHAFHGVTDEEHIIGGSFLADISYITDTKATETDNITDTISYADIYDLVKDEMMKPSQLIEHVAGRIMKVIKHRFPQIQELTVKISKLNPPVNGEAEKATVTIKD